MLPLRLHPPLLPSTRYSANARSYLARWKQHKKADDISFARFLFVPFLPLLNIIPATEVFLKRPHFPSNCDLLTTSSPSHPSHNRTLPPPVSLLTPFLYLLSSLHYSPLHLSAMCSNCTYARGPQTLGLGSPGTSHHTLCQRMFNQAATLPKPDLRVKMM